MSSVHGKARQGRSLAKALSNLEIIITVIMIKMMVIMVMMIADYYGGDKDYLLFNK